MAGGLKDRLNTLAADTHAKDQTEKEAIERYRAKALREYPRMLETLLASTHRVLDGVNGLKFAEQRVEQTLTQTVGSYSWSAERGNEDNTRKEVLGKVMVPEWTISFLGRRMSFRGAGLDFLGVHSKIDVITDRTNPFPKGGIFMSTTRSDPDTWVLILASDRPNRNSDALTDDMLSEILEAYFSAAR